MKEAHADGKLAPGVSATCFTTPRPVYELYDLEADPSELNNLSGKPELAAVERAAAVTALRESEERYRTLFETMDQGFCVIEMLFDEAGRPFDYRFLEMNPAFEA